MPIRPRSTVSFDRAASFVDCKQLVLFIIVPLVYRLFRGRRALLATDVIISVGALTHSAPSLDLSLLLYN